VGRRLPDLRARWASEKARSNPQHPLLPQDPQHPLLLSLPSPGHRHRRARSEVAFRLPDGLGLGGGGGGPDGDAFDEIGSEDDLFSTFMDIEKISSSGPSNRDCDRAAETSSPPRQLSSAPGLQNLRGAATAVGDMEAAVPSRVALSAASRLPNRHAMAGAPSPSLPILAPFCQFVRIWMRFWE